MGRVTAGSYETHHVDAGPAVRRDLALATWGLFVGLAFLLLAGGLFGTLLGVRAETEGLATGVTGLISAAYYLGFVVGSRLTLAALGRVGHIRVYAALAALLTAAMLGVGLTDVWVPWAFFRLVTGLCFAGMYVVAVTLPAVRRLDSLVSVGVSVDKELPRGFSLALAYAYTANFSNIANSLDNRSYSKHLVTLTASYAL